MQFQELHLREEILRAIQERGYDEPTPIRAKAIPAVLEGLDVIGSAQTGTGKTGICAAFLAPPEEAQPHPLFSTHPYS